MLLRSAWLVQQNQPTAPGISAGCPLERGFYSRMMRRWIRCLFTVIHCSMDEGASRKAVNMRVFVQFWISHFQNSLFYSLLAVNLLEATKHVAEGGRIHVSWKSAASS